MWMEQVKNIISRDVICIAVNNSIVKKQTKILYVIMKLEEVMQCLN